MDGWTDGQTDRFAISILMVLTGTYTLISISRVSMLMRDKNTVKWIIRPNRH